MNFMPNLDQPTKINLAMLSVCLVYLIFNALKVCKVWCLEIQKQIHIGSKISNKSLQATFYEYTAVKRTCVGTLYHCADELYTI